MFQPCEEAAGKHPKPSILGPLARSIKIPAMSQQRDIFCMEALLSI